jgi:hypothetical protein
MERDELVRHDYPPNGRPSESSRRITSCEEDRRRSNAACQARAFFGIASPLGTNGDRRAFLPRDVSDNERTLLGSNAEEGDRCKLRSPSGVVY